MAEQLDISYVIKDAVKDYITPKHKIYRIIIAEVLIQEDEDSDPLLYSVINTDIIEIINKEEYDKYVKNRTEQLELPSCSTCKQGIDNNLLDHHSYMEESTFNKFIKEKIWRSDTHRNLILIDYKQLA